jgi:hypothetical protein
MWWPAVVKSELELRLDYGRSPHAYVNQRLQIHLELLMMSGVPLETCWALNERWNNKFCYKVASCWLFLLNQMCFTSINYDGFIPPIKNKIKFKTKFSRQILIQKLDAKSHLILSISWDKIGKKVQFFLNHAFILYSLITVTLRRNCLTKHIINGKIDGTEEVTGRRGIRGKQLLNDDKEKRRDWKLIALCG